jgi:hypothetical protein
MISEHATYCILYEEYPYPAGPNPSPQSLKVNRKYSQSSAECDEIAWSGLALPCSASWEEREEQLFKLYFVQAVSSHMVQPCVPVGSQEDLDSSRDVIGSQPDWMLLRPWGFLQPCQSLMRVWDHMTSFLKT